MKRIIALILIITIVATIAVGCKSNKQDKTEPTETTSNSIEGTESGSQNATKPEGGDLSTDPTNDATKPTGNPNDEKPTEPVGPKPTDQPQTDPIFTFTIDGREFQFDIKLSEMLQYFALPMDYENSSLMTMPARDFKEITLVTSTGATFFVGVRNETDNPIPLEECLVFSVEADWEISDIISIRPAYNEINMSLSIDEIERTIGDCDICKGQDEHDAMIWFWRDSPDQDLISIALYYNLEYYEIDRLYIAYDSWKLEEGWEDTDWSDIGW